jgi:hypothetical protein
MNVYLKMSALDSSRIFAGGALLAAIWSFSLGSTIDSIGSMPLHLMIWAFVSILSYAFLFLHSNVTSNATANLPFLLPAIAGVQLGEVGTT